MSHYANILLSAFGGLGVPATVSFALPSSSTFCDLTKSVEARIPALSTIGLRLVLSTTDGTRLTPSTAPLSSLLSPHIDRDASAESTTLLPLRLSALLPGGKGGFGSQLRAQGGRMSSRKRRNQDPSMSLSRDLNGRRVRTMTQAKNISTYRRLKAEQEKKERDERHKRWQDIVDAADRKEQEIRSGKGARVDGKWADAKEEVEDRTRDAVVQAYRSGDIGNLAVLGAGDKESDRSQDASDEAGSESDVGVGTSKGAGVSKYGDSVPRTFHGWDDDAEFMSDSSDSDGEASEGDEDIVEGDEDEDDEDDDEDGLDGSHLDETVGDTGKGKGRAMV